MINDGRFSQSLSQALGALILEPHRTGQPVSDHEMRFVAGNGFWYGIYSVARAGHHALVILAFERGEHAVNQEAKDAMFKALDIASQLVIELLDRKLTERVSDDE